MYITKTFTPQQLFQMVWDTPVLKLARQICVSDVGLAKACRKAGIALPKRGHWAKPEPQRLKRPKPPSSADVIEFRVLDPEAILEESKASVPVARLNVKTPTELSDPHPLVRRWLAATRRAIG